MAAGIISLLIGAIDLDDLLMRRTVQIIAITAIFLSICKSIGVKMPKVKEGPFSHLVATNGDLLQWYRVDAAIICGLLAAATFIALLLQQVPDLAYLTLALLAGAVFAVLFGQIFVRSKAVSAAKSVSKGHISHASGPFMLLISQSRRQIGAIPAYMLTVLIMAMGSYLAIFIQSISDIQHLDFIILSAAAFTVGSSVLRYDPTLIKFMAWHPFSLFEVIWKVNFMPIALTTFAAFLAGLSGGFSLEKSITLVSIVTMALILYRGIYTLYAIRYSKDVIHYTVEIELIILIFITFLYIPMGIIWGIYRAYNLTKQASEKRWHSL